MNEARQCPVCRQTPNFMGGGRTSARRRVFCGILVGCTHVQRLSGFAIVEAGDMPAAVARWNEEAERLFAAQTAHWTDAQRSTFRRELGWPLPAPISDLPSPISAAPRAASVA